uniref:Extracellular calcium-sensing receptor-like n=1 Tax=Sinocyclocheilus anshuiensis TaxID=1608454 RepID=A0A671QB78_9TELE
MASFQQAQTMVFAIDEINKNPDLLPNITLGYQLYDNCVMLGMAFRAALSLVSGTEVSFSNLNCTGPPPVIGIVSYFATCSCLSNRKKYPSFFRTIPSDAFQVRAMIKILKHFGWTWVGLVYSDDDYGNHAAQSFLQDIQVFGGCVAFSEILPLDNNRKYIQHTVGVIQASTARVVVVFSTSTYLLPLMDEVVLQNVTDRQWIASEAWATSPVFHTQRLLPFLGGTLGIAIRRGEIQGLHEFLLHLRPNNDQRNNMVRIFWENMFKCRFNIEGRGEKMCSGQEDLSNTDTAYTDVSELRASYNVYKTVYSLAHALHDLMQCVEGRGPFSGNSCADITNLQPWQKVNFTTGFGDLVSFDENGDALAIYDVMNWQPSSDGSIVVRTVGVVNEGAATGKPPQSVCSESCSPGTRRARRKGLPVCCFDCLPCADGEISNTTDANECTICPDDFWSNPDKDRCVPKEEEFLSYEDPLGISLTTASLLEINNCSLCFHYSLIPLFQFVLF